jgi:hypothetical protein
MGIRFYKSSFAHSKHVDQDTIPNVVQLLFGKNIVLWQFTFKTQLKNALLNFPFVSLTERLYLLREAVKNIIIKIVRFLPPG